MHVRNVIRMGVAVAIAATLAACTDERIVYKDVSRMDPLPTNAGGFLGFAKSGDTVNTVCGTCHAGRQSDWMQTKHASAWSDLQASGHASAACEGCHTVNQLGNGFADAAAGYNGTKDARYRNVQCESCHGPGQAHLNNPGSSNLPLASASQGTDPKGTNGCGACHQGTHHPFLEEWAQSPHAVMEYTQDPAEDPAHIIEGTVATGTECQGCHTGEYALRKDPASTLSTDVIGFKAGVKAGYKEATHVPKVNDFMKITCLVCHDPHRNGNAGQLRFPVATADTAQNLCIRCHNRRATNPTSWRGPHSGEGQLVMGLNSGWRPPGMPALPTAIFGTHADPKGNPRQCATCHMATYAVNDAAGALISNTTGHLFNGFPCKDAKGVPVGGTCSIDQRSFKGCVGSGCHSSETAARSVFLNSEGRVEALMEELQELLENTAKVPCTEFVYAGKPITVARGARFNYLLAAGHGHQVADQCSALSNGEFIRSLPTPVPSEGAVVHNPAYLEQLLRGSISAVKATYYK